MLQKKTNGKILSILFAGVLIITCDISVVGPAIQAIENSVKPDGQTQTSGFN
jgi:hypothetical protein